MNSHRGIKISMRAFSGRQSQSGFTLLEVLIAGAILAIIGVLSYQSLDTAIRSSEVSTEQLESIRELDRVWVLLENDVRNALALKRMDSSLQPLSSMILDVNDLRWLTFYRGGQANPMGLPRTEVLRVAYRLEEGVLWRDSWVDPYAEIDDEEYTRSQRLLDGVTEITARALSRESSNRSFDSGNWSEEWPTSQQPQSLPLALEITLTVERLGDITRLFALVPGTDE